MNYTQSEGTAARRRFSLYLVDATDGITPETGEAAGQPQISKAGGAWANTTATLTALGNGGYYVELTAAELDTLGVISVRYKSANTAEFQAPAMVVAHNQHDAVRMGLTALPNAAADAAGGLPISDAGGLDLDARLDAAVTTRAAASALTTAQNDLDLLTGADGATLATAQALYAPAKAGDAMALTSGERTTLAAAIWNALTSGMSTVGSIGKKLADWVVGTIDTYTGNTKQTGDSFARLGAPADASVSADVAAVKAQTAAIETDTTEIGAAGAGLTALATQASVNTIDDFLDTEVAAILAAVDTEIAAIKAKTDLIPAAPAAVGDIPSAATIAAAVVAETITELASVPGASPTLKQALALLYMALRNKVLSGASLRIHNDAGTIVATKTQSDDGTTYTEAKAT